VAWADLRVDGARPRSGHVLIPGVRVGWRRPILVLRGACVSLQQVIDRAVTRLARSDRFQDGFGHDDLLVETQLGLTDGARTYRAYVVRMNEVSRPFLVIGDQLPHPGAELVVIGPSAEEAGAPVSLPMSIPAARAR